MSNQDAMRVHTPQDHDNAKRKYLQQQRMDHIKRVIITLAYESYVGEGIPRWGYVKDELRRCGYADSEWSAAFNDLLLDMQDTSGYYYEKDINGDSIRVMGRDQRRGE